MYLRYTFNLASTKEDEEMAAGAFEGAVMLTMMDAKENSIPPMDLPIPRQCSKGKHLLAWISKRRTKSPFILRNQSSFYIYFN